MSAPSHSLAVRRGLLAVAPFLWACSLLLTSAVAAPAAEPPTPRDELLRFVPENVGFCFILQDFREQMKTLSDSPFAEQLDKSPIGQAFHAAKEIKQLAEVAKQLPQQVGVGWEELRDDILGDAVIFAFRPAPPGKPEQDQGLVLLYARDPKKLTVLIAYLNDAQKKSGQLKSVDEREHNGVKYFRRIETKETNYYALRGSVLVFSGQEPILQEALERKRVSVGEPPLGRRLRAAGLPRALLTACINPRAFDDLLEAKTKNSKIASEVAFLKAFAAYWKATDGIICSLAFDKELLLTLTVQGRGDQLPTAARRLFSEASRPSAVWPALPENALLAAAGRIDVSALVDVLGDFMTKENRAHFNSELDRNLGAILGKSFIKEVLPSLGPDVGLALVAPLPKDKNWVPQALFALRVGPGEDATAPVDQALVSALKFFAQAAAIGHNRQNPRQTITLKTIQQEQRDVHLLVGDATFPPGVQPSLSLANGFLLLASSPEMLAQFAAALAQPGKAPVQENVPLLRLSLRDLRTYLKDRREPLAHLMADNEHITNEDAQQRLDALIGTLQLIDRMEMSQRTSTGQTTLTLSIQSAYPFRK